MNIVVLDKLHFSEENLERLRTIGNVTVHDDHPDTETAITRLADADIAIIGWTTLRRSNLDRLPRLKYISLALTGFDIIDVEAARERGILVTNVPEYSRQSVAEYTFALALSAIRHLRDLDAQVRAGNAISPAENLLGHELYRKTLGVLGVGSIGSWVARIGQGFGMQVIGHSRTHKDVPGVENVSLDDILRRSDVLVLTLSVNPSSTGLLTRQRLALMKRGASLINIASNQLIDEQAVADMLDSGHLGSAAFEDITHSGFDEGAVGSQSPLLHARNVVLSPQAGWFTVEAHDRLLDLTVENVELYAAGTPRNVV
ncbi:2-hydroxyacid dehydrogenase [Dactylosporangium cerinum]|uniref:2-hydroxyacid dehydrogenase n=1 Tax=Dactylosporangium cerinum TaxID=1434730 RepID=A0ABV9W0J6_9ACTN